MPARCAAPLWPPRDSAHLLVSGAAMAALEQQLFANGLPVEALMEKAALAMSQRLLEQHGQALLERGALVLVGPGHNGGDGLVIARELHLAGMAVRIWSPFERHKPLTERHLHYARWLGITQLASPPDPSDPALWIDALLGSGQQRPAGATIESLLEARRQRRPGHLVAIDVPTGLCADSGQLTGSVAAQACRTYAIGLLKTGLIQDQALAWVGQLERIELGLPPAVLAALPSQQPLALLPNDGATAPWPSGDPAAGKYQRGRLLLLAGSEAYRGAAHLALAGARASGCGSLRAALAGTLAHSLWQMFPEVVLAQQLASGSGGQLLLGGLAPEQLARLDVLLVGPGLGLGEGDNGHAAPSNSEAKAWGHLQRFAGLLVLDADGLNRLAQAKAHGRDGASTWLQQRQGPTWLTPHRGEFGRIFPDLAAASPLEAASEAAQRSGTTVLLKGARSVVAAPDGRRWQLLTADPRAARAGLGDVLAGYAAGLGARGRASTGHSEPSLLALAALAHAEAGRRAAQQGDSSPGAVAQQLHKAEHTSCT